MNEQTRFEELLDTLPFPLLDEDECDVEDGVPVLIVVHDQGGPQ